MLFTFIAVQNTQENLANLEACSHSRGSDMHNIV